MTPVGAIVFLPREGSERPVLLNNLLFSPGALWLSEALTAHGVSRFLVVCQDEDRAAAERCFPRGSEFVTDGSEDAAGKLTAFLNEGEGDVVVVTQPVLVPFPTPEDQLTVVMDGGTTRPGICVISGRALADGLAAGRDFETALKEQGSHTGPAGMAMALSSRTGNKNDLLAAYVSVNRLADAGVRVLDQSSVYVDPAVTVGAGTVLLPGTILRGKTIIGKDCEIGPNTMITDCVVGDGVVVNASQMSESFIEDGVKVGPFAYVRPHCHVGKGVKVGDFVEIKNSNIGAGTKISHLTYVGDSDVGSGVNFGCGTVTVNYDGATKLRTVIGDNAFIGCNTNLVAPVKVGEGAYTAAGSTITEDVPDDSLAIARSLQVIKKQWALKRRKRNT